MTLFEDLQDLMVNNHFRPEKKLSQFFCINEALLIFLLNKVDLKKGDVVLEIGPGTGFFTKLLLEKSKKVGARVVAIEFGENMYELLKKKFEKEISNNELELVFGDALKFNWEDFKINKIASLPPYHISSSLLSKVILTNGLSKAVLILDKGFVDKIVSFEGLTEYGALTAMINLNSKATVVESNIAPQSFFPTPNCQSAVLQLDFEYKNNSEEYFVFLKEIFRHKNKDLQKSLKQSSAFLSKSLEWDKELIESKISFFKNAQKKVYLLSPEELLNVFDYLKSFQPRKKIYSKSKK